MQVSRSTSWKIRSSVMKSKDGGLIRQCTTIFVRNFLNAMKFSINWRMKNLTDFSPNKSICVDLDMLMRSVFSDDSWSQGEYFSTQNELLLFSCPFAAPVYDFTGLPMPISTVPFATDMSVNPTYFERARNLFTAVITNLEFTLLNNQLAAHFHQKFGEDFPAPSSIAKNVDVIFIATDEIIDISTTTLQNIVHVGGLGVDDDTTEMSDEFSAEMAKGKNGVIYFSLGTIANTTTIDENVMKSVLSIVQKFPDYHFLIRADKYDKVCFSFSCTLSKSKHSRRHENMQRPWKMLLFPTGYHNLPFFVRLMLS